MLGQHDRFRCPPRWESRAGLCLRGSGDAWPIARAKQFETYAEQVDLLQRRGLEIRDRDWAENFLQRFNYYRLSGYWYPLLKFTAEDGVATENFIDGASLDLVAALYEFDERLRHSVFRELDRVEMAVRALLGYELGRIDPLIHLAPESLGARAQQRLRDRQTRYEVWRGKYESALRVSKEDFVRHHQRKYRGEMPIWVAVEIMDWGMVSHLYGMSPNLARNRVAERCDLSAPQLESWLKSLNVLRNLAAHHARMFNRVYDIKPKLKKDVRLTPLAGTMNRVFGQLSLIQYLHRQLGLSQAERLPSLMATYPINVLVPFSRTGAPEHWQELELWST